MTEENTEAKAAPADETSGKKTGTAQRAATKRPRAGGGGKAAKKAAAPKKGAPSATRGGTKVKRAAGGVRTGTKQAKLIAMLRTPEGTTIEQAAKAFGWQPHTVRGAIYGSLKKAGLNVVSEKTEDGGRVYRIAD
jgi:hypothetical protein